MAYMDGYAAYDMGLFKKHGLDVTLTTPTNNSAQTAIQVASGGADIALTAPTATIATVVAGRSPRLFAAGAKFSTTVLVLSSNAANKLKTSGVTPTSPVDDRVKGLKGLRINIASPGGSNEVQLRATLSKLGMNPDKDVHMISGANASVATDVAAMTSGQIDGYMFSPPAALQPTTNGQGVLWLSGPAGDFVGSGYFLTWSATPDMLKRTDVISSFRAALEDFHTALTKDPDSVKQALRARYSDVDDATYTISFDTLAKAFKGPALDKPSLEAVITTYNATADPNAKADAKLEIAASAYVS
jgi:ABC-type nitrate/sulfonate/bicarbonate transport system substrate-binding protein